MNAEKLKRLQTEVRIGGKGTPRRKKKVIHQSATTDDKKLQSSLKKLSVNTIPGIEEVNIIKDDLTVIHFNNPKTQASLSANIFAVNGHGETRKIVEMLPEILPQLGQETVMQLRLLANSMSNHKKQQVSASNILESGVTDDDEVPTLVTDFDEVAKFEATSNKKESKSKAKEENNETSQLLNQNASELQAIYKTPKDGSETENQLKISNENKKNDENSKRNAKQPAKGADNELQSKKATQNKEKKMTKDLNDKKNVAINLNESKQSNEKQIQKQTNKKVENTLKAEVELENLNVESNANKSCEADHIQCMSIQIDTKEKTEVTDENYEKVQAGKMEKTDAEKVNEIKSKIETNIIQTEPITILEHKENTVAVMTEVNPEQDEMKMSDKRVNQISEENIQTGVQDNIDLAPCPPKCDVMENEMITLTSIKDMDSTNDQLLEVTTVTEKLTVKTDESKSAVKQVSHDAITKKPSVNLLKNKQAHKVRIDKLNITQKPMAMEGLKSETNQKPNETASKITQSSSEKAELQAVKITEKQPQMTADATIKVCSSGREAETKMPNQTLRSKQMPQNASKSATTATKSQTQSKQSSTDFNKTLSKPATTTSPPKTTKPIKSTISPKMNAPPIQTPTKKTTTTKSKAEKSNSNPQNCPTKPIKRQNDGETKAKQYIQAESTMVTTVKSDQGSAPVKLATVEPNQNEKIGAQTEKSGN